MELKQAAELSICALLREQISDLAFYPSRGGGDDVTPLWLPNNNYKFGDLLRSNNPAKVHAIVVIAPGISGATEPAFTDVVWSTIQGPGGVVYQTIPDLAVTQIVDSGNPMPPYAVVSIDDGEKTMAQEGTNFLNGIVVWVTRADTTDVITHLDNFKRIYDAMTKLGNGYDILRRIMIHGIDVQATSEFTDYSRKAHGDTISFVMGITERFGQLGF